VFMCSLVERSIEQWVNVREKLSPNPEMLILTSYVVMVVNYTFLIGDVISDA
jgi:hypothetical protein